MLAMLRAMLATAWAMSAVARSEVPDTTAPAGTVRAVSWLGTLEVNWMI
jgi:hypothetical protein